MQAAIAVSNATMTPLQTEVPPNKLLDLVRKVNIFLLSFGLRCKILEVWDSSFSKAALICLNLSMIQKMNIFLASLFIIFIFALWVVCLWWLAARSDSEADDWNKSFLITAWKRWETLLGNLNSLLSFNNRTCTAWPEVDWTWMLQLLVCCRAWLLTEKIRYLLLLTRVVVELH